MTSESVAGRLGLGAMLARSLDLVRLRWPEFLALVICIHWMPRVFVTLFGSHYAVGSRYVGSIAAYGVQSVAIALCSALMQASVIVIGLDGANRRMSPQAAITRVLRRLSTLGPWWLLGVLPNVIKVWVRWSVHTNAELRATYYWQEFGSTAYFIALDGLLGLYPLIVLADGLAVRAALTRTMRLMSAGRGTVLVVAAPTDIAFMALNLAMPYATALSFNLGLGEAGFHAAYFGYVFAFDALAVVVNLVWVQLYRELARAHDGVAPGELAHIFA